MVSRDCFHLHFCDYGKDEHLQCVLLAGLSLVQLLILILYVRLIIFFITTCRNSCSLGNNPVVHHVGYIDSFLSFHFSFFIGSFAIHIFS